MVPEFKDLFAAAAEIPRAMAERGGQADEHALVDNLRAVALDRVGTTGFGPRPGLPQADAALHARDKLRKAEDRVGPAAWPILTRIVIEGAGVRECRGFVPELATPWRADAVVADRLRVGLDLVGELFGVTRGLRAGGGGS